MTEGSIFTEKRQMQEGRRGLVSAELRKCLAVSVAVGLPSCASENKLTGNAWLREVAPIRVVTRPGGSGDGIG